MILLITEQGAQVSLDGGKILIKTQNLERSLPKELIEIVSIFGNVQLTTPFIRHCLMRKIQISYFILQGKYFGWTISTARDNITRLKKQIKITEDSVFRRDFAENTIEAKINNQVTLLRRFHRRKGTIQEEIQDMVKLKEKLKTCQRLKRLWVMKGWLPGTTTGDSPKVFPKIFNLISELVGLQEIPLTP